MDKKLSQNVEGWEIPEEVLLKTVRDNMLTKMNMVQSSPVISVFLWMGLQVQTGQRGAAGGRGLVENDVEQKKAECTQGS